MVTVISEAFYEVQKYLYETNHIIATLEVIVSAPFFDKLSPEHQKVVREAAKATAVTAWDNYLASVDKDRQFLKSKGVTVTPVSDADRQKAADRQAVCRSCLGEAADRQDPSGAVKGRPVAGRSRKSPSANPHGLMAAP